MCLAPFLADVPDHYSVSCVQPQGAGFLTELIAANDADREGWNGDIHSAVQPGGASIHRSDARGGRPSSALLPPWQATYHSCRAESRGTAGDPDISAEQRDPEPARGRR